MSEVGHRVVDRAAVLPAAGENGGAVGLLGPMLLVDRLGHVPTLETRDHHALPTGVEPAPTGLTSRDPNHWATTAWYRRRDSNPKTPDPKSGRLSQSACVGMWGSPQESHLDFLPAEACFCYTKGPCGGFSSPSPLGRLTRVVPGCPRPHHPSVYVEHIGIEPIGVSLQGRPVHQHMPHEQS